MTKTAGWLVRRTPWILGVVVLVADQVTKQIALGTLKDGPVDVVWTLRMRLTYNSGMAFGAGTGFGPAIAVLAFLIIVVLARSMSRQRTRAVAIALGLLVGGATGNFMDRVVRSPGLLRGSVVDFIDFQWFPVFNVADIAINLGAALLVLSLAREARGRASKVNHDS